MATSKYSDGLTPYDMELALDRIDEIKQRSHKRTEPLHELIATLETWQETLEATDDPVQREEIQKRIENDIAPLVVAKVDRVAEFFRWSVSEEARLLGEEIKIAEEFTATRNKVKRRAEWFKGELHKLLDRVPDHKLKGAYSTLRLQDNPPGAPIITDHISIPADYVTVIPPRLEVNIAALKKALVAGVEVPGAELPPKKQHVRID